MVGGKWSVSVICSEEAITRVFVGQAALILHTTLGSHSLLYLEKTGA